MNRRRDIEGLRAVAVGAVLAFHAGLPRFDGGYVGVDAFFVISGFLITSLLIRERTSTGSISLTSFYARRVRRLLPMSALVAVLTAAAARVWLEPLRIQNLATDLRGVATFSVNFVFSGRNADYLQSTLPPSPLQHYWSLAVEEQFYVFWPMLVVCACWKGRRVVARVAGLSVAVAVGSFVACMLTMKNAQPLAFFSPHTRAFELAGGAIVATLPPLGRVRSAARHVEAAAGWVGLAALIACVVIFDANTTFPGPWAIVPVVATMFVLRSGEDNSWGPHVVLRLSPLQWLGSRSYSAYLWHWPVLIIVPAIAGAPLTGVQRAACVLVTLGLSELSYRWVENPIHRNAVLRGPRAAALGVSLVLIVLGSSVLTGNNVPALATDVEATTPTIAIATTTTVDSALSGATTSTTVVSTSPTLPPLSGPIEAITQAAGNSVVPSNITPKLSAAVLDESRIYKNDCHTSFSATVQKNCVFGDKNGKVVVGLYGDSHAAEWFPTLEKVAIARGWKLITYTKRGCPPAEIPTFSRVLGHNYTQCVPWRKNVLAKMAADKVQVVLVANFDRLLSATNRLPVWPRDWRVGLQGTIDELKKRNIVPVLVQDTPYPGQDIPTCLSANLTNVSQCSPIRSNAIREDIRAVRRELATANNVQLLETTDWFCTTTVCPAVVGNLLVYRDDNHMTAKYAEFLAPLLDASLGDYVDSVAGGK